MHMPTCFCRLYWTLQVQLCIILRACVVHKRGVILAEIQPQLSHCCQFWMAYQQVGSNCFQTQRPMQETEWQLCYVDCCCRVGRYLLPLQWNGSRIKLARSHLQLVIQRSTAGEWLTPQDHAHKCMLFACYHALTCIKRTQLFSLSSVPLCYEQELYPSVCVFLIR